MPVATLYTFTLASGTAAIDFAETDSYAVPNVRDLAFDKSTGRFRLVGGNLSFTQGIDAVRQSVEIRLQFFLGEWFLDTSRGMAYYQQVFIKNPSLPGVRVLFRNQILGTPGVRNVTKLEVTLNRDLRKMRVDWAADTDFGELKGSSERVIA